MKSDELIQHWRGVRAGLEEILIKFKDTDLDYIPFPGSWPVVRLILHIAHEEEGEILYGLARQLPTWPEEPAAGEYSTIDSIKTRLTEVHQRTETYLVTLSGVDLDKDFEPAWGGHQPLKNWIWHTIDHEMHHRGELSLILGLLGREGLNA